MIFVGKRLVQYKDDYYEIVGRLHYHKDIPIEEAKEVFNADEVLYGENDVLYFCEKIKEVSYEEETNEGNKNLNAISDRECNESNKLE